MTHIRRQFHAVRVPLAVLSQFSIGPIAKLKSSCGMQFDQIVG